MASRKAPVEPIGIKPIDPFPFSAGSIENFNAVALQLATADEKARVTSSDAGAARAERGFYAVQAIHAAVSEEKSVEDVRETLLDAGVLKGTVSKITTIVSAVMAGDLLLGQIKSLNGAYTAVKAASKGRIVGGGSAVGAIPLTYAYPVEPVTVTTPDEALTLIIDTVKSITDPDEAYRVGGEWITKITNGITAALKAIDDGDEEE